VARAYSRKGSFARAFKREVALPGEAELAREVEEAAEAMERGQ